MAELARDLIEAREAVFDEGEPAVGLFDQIKAAGDRGAIPVDADDLSARRRQDGAGVAARPEGAVDVQAAGADVRKLPAWGASTGM